MFSPLCYPFSCIRFSYIPTSCTRLLHLTGCSFPYFLHESRQLRIPEFSQSCTPHAKNQVLSVPVLFYNQSQTHALLSDRLPRIVLPGAHRPPQKVMDEITEEIHSYQLKIATRDKHTEKISGQDISPVSYTHLTLPTILRV